MLAPFNLPPPQFYILDMVRRRKFGVWPSLTVDQDDTYFKNEPADGGIKLMGLWKLPALGMGDGTAFPVNFDQAKELVFLE